MGGSRSALQLVPSLYLEQINERLHAGLCIKTCRPSSLVHFQIKLRMQKPLWRTTTPAFITNLATFLQKLFSFRRRRGRRRKQQVKAWGDIFQNCTIYLRIPGVTSRSENKPPVKSLERRSGCRYELEPAAVSARR